MTGAIRTTDTHLIHVLDTPTPDTAITLEGGSLRPRETTTLIADPEEDA